MTEIWKTIEGYEGIYEVSDRGRVRSLDRMQWGGRRMLKGKVLSPNSSGVGYPLISLCRHGSQKTIKVHRLVANAFLPNPEGLPQVNHKNGIKDDNRLGNLEWCSSSYNVKHAFDTGLACKVGDMNSQHKVTANDIPSIRARRAAGETYSSIAADYPICAHAVMAICSRRSWSHV